ncbi:hydrogenase small subunit [Caloramator fervidus]|uniref:Hydrogenase small subunit n=1 Tax=Caloramator fervidus TaxID=29344 RepID=A0A1H5VLT4_9CLOT|nr:hydrogenase small subunit [Caloramator fervidus]SEF88214.1 hydrogenase small subunit [Caloramator fervidus]
MKNCLWEVINNKNSLSKALAEEVAVQIRFGKTKKPNVIWIEATGCSGNTISLMNADYPDLIYLLDNMINLKFSNSLMVCDGERAFESFLKTLKEDFILVVEGAVSTKEDGLFNIIANYKGNKITAYDAIKMAGAKAKSIIAVGTCASFGGVSKAYPNPSEAKSVKEVLQKDVINLPGCPSHPEWIIGTLAYIITNEKIEVDDLGRPLLFYGFTIHDFCERRVYFNNRIFAKNIGEPWCMFKLGCRGPVTKTDCPKRRWNNKVNWPIGDNTPCIGCANAYFPDGMEPFIRL